jgi:hypothetical protein
MKRKHFLALSGLAPLALMKSPASAQEPKKFKLDPSGKPYQLEGIPLKGFPKIKFIRIKRKQGADADGKSDGYLKSAPSVEKFIDRLPEWGEIYPKSQRKSTSAKTSKVVENGVQYDVTKSSVSLTTTPEDIITFQPVNAFWLGSVIQEQGMVEGIGSFTEVPIEAAKRPRLKITTDLLIADNSETVNQPSAASVQQAVSKLITQAPKGRKKTGSISSWNMTENHSVEQTALAFGLDAYYMGASVKGALQSNTSASRRAVSAIFIEKAFTVKVDFEGRSGASAFFNDRFTMEDARKLVDRGQITMNNLPTYLASITYGRILIFTMTANADESDIKGAIEASYNALVLGGSINTKYRNILANGETHISVQSVGGPAAATSALIKSGKLADFFSQEAPLTSMVPISYTVNTLRENRLAAMARTTDYTTTTYTANETVRKYKVTMYWKVVDSDDGIADNTVECFGELRINGTRRWAIPRDLSDTSRNKREKGETIDIGDGDLGGMGTGKPFELTSDTINPTIYQLSGYLKDSDGGSADDTLLKFENFPLNLEKLAGKGTESYGNKDIIEAILKEQGKKMPPIPLPQGPARLCIRVDRV